MNEHGQIPKKEGAQHKYQVGLVLHYILNQARYSEGLITKEVGPSEWPLAEMLTSVKKEISFIDPRKSMEISEYSFWRGERRPRRASLLRVDTGPHKTLVNRFWGNMTKYIVSPKEITTAKQHSPILTRSSQLPQLCRSLFP